MFADPKTPVQTCLIPSINKHRFSGFLIYGDRYFIYGKIYPFTPQAAENLSSVFACTMLLPRKPRASQARYQPHGPLFSALFPIPACASENPRGQRPFPYRRRALRLQDDARRCLKPAFFLRILRIAPHFSRVADRGLRHPPPICDSLHLG